MVAAGLRLKPSLMAWTITTITTSKSDLSAYNATSDFKIAIEGGMSSTSDWFYVDHLKLLGYEAFGL